MAIEGSEPQAGSQNEPGTPASANDPSGRPDPISPQPPANAPFDRAAALAALPEGLQAGLSAAPTPVIQQAIADLESGFIAKPDYTRTRQQETQELKELREKLQREETQRQTMERLMEQSYGRDPVAPAPEAPKPRELAQKLLEVSDPDEYWEVLGQAVGPMVDQRAQQLLSNHPILRRLEAATAVEAAMPQGMDPATYRAGYESFNADLRAAGMDPDLVDSQVKAYLTPVWAEREQLRQQLRSGGNGAPTPAPAAPAGAPAVTPPSATGAGARTTTPEIDVTQTHGPESTLKDRVSATLAQLGMTPGDLTRLRQGQRSV